MSATEKSEEGEILSSTPAATASSAAAAMGVDMELKKAFQELQQQVMETRTKLQLIDAQTEVARRSATRARLTATELKSMSTDTPVYESVGRAFYTRPLADMVAQLDTEAATGEEKVKTLAESKTKLEKRVKDTENNLRELVAQKLANK